MTDTEVYCFYEEPFGVDQRLAVLPAVYGITSLDPAAEFETLQDRLSGFRETWVTASYGSIVVTITFGYDHDTRENAPDLPCIRLSLDDAYFLTPLPHGPDEKAHEHIEDLVALILELYEASREAGLTPRYVIGASPTEVTAIRGDYGESKTTAAGVLEGTVEQLYWLQVLPPVMVADLGRDHLRTAPAARIEELDDGAVLLKTTELPETPTQEFVDIQRHLSVEPEW